jgi:hypothetical protein
MQAEEAEGSAVCPDSKQAVEASCTKAEQLEAKLPTIPAHVGSDVDFASDEVQPRRLQLLVFSGEEVRSLELPAVGTMSIDRGEESTIRGFSPEAPAARIRRTVLVAGFSIA